MKISNAKIKAYEALIAFMQDKIDAIEKAEEAEEDRKLLEQISLEDLD